MIEPNIKVNKIRAPDKPHTHTHTYRLSYSYQYNNIKFRSDGCLNVRVESDQVQNK